MSKINELFTSKINVINVGIELFKDDILAQNASATHLEWSPPGGGKPEIIAALNKIDKAELAEKIEAANRLAVEKIVNSQPVLIGFDQAINVVPGMTKKQFYTQDHPLLGKI